MPHEGRLSSVTARLWLSSPLLRARRLRSWRPRRQAIGLVQSWEEQSWACPEAPPDLLQSIRDELGRLNQPHRNGENVFLAVSVYRFDKGGIWTLPPAYDEVVVRDLRGPTVWAAEDKIEARENLAGSLADTPSAIIAREGSAKPGRFLGANSDFLVGIPKACR
jgi:hypothetical protein